MQENYFSFKSFILKNVTIFTGTQNYKVVDTLVSVLVLVVCTCMLCLSL